MATQDPPVADDRSVSGPVAFMDLHCHTSGSFDCLSDPRVHTVGPDEQVCGEDGAVGQGGLDMVVGVGHIGDLRPTPNDNASTLGLALESGRNPGALHGQCNQAIVERTPEVYPA